MVALLKMPRGLNFSQFAGTSLTGAERRMFPRKKTRPRVEARRLDHSLSALQQPSLRMELRDLSIGGLSAHSEQPLLAGERVNGIFPPQDHRGGWEAVGRVLRCDPSSLGSRVAVAFDPLPAA